MVPVESVEPNSFCSCIVQIMETGNIKRKQMDNQGKTVMDKTIGSILLLQRQTLALFCFWLCNSLLSVEHTDEPRGTKAAYVLQPPLW